MYYQLEQENNDAIKTYRMSQQETPITETEEKISSVFCEMFDVPSNTVWVGTSLFDYGITSIELVTFKQRVQTKLATGIEIPIVMVMVNPTIRGMAEALNTLMKGPQPYNPVVPLRTEGDKTPMWLIHPATGEIFVFINLAKYITDRPLYALRARGFDADHKCFDNLSECLEVYYAHIKETQPQGPYALVGYSQGSIIAFELIKMLEADGDKVIFHGGLDTPPHIRSLIGKTDWITMLVDVSYLLELTTYDKAREIEEGLRQCSSNEEAMDKVLEVATDRRRRELDINPDKLRKWVNVNQSLVKLLQYYEPRGAISSIDVFVAKDSGRFPQKEWVEDHLGKWNGFTGSQTRMHECEGTHIDMMSTENVVSFQSVLRAVLRERGI